VQFSSPSFHIRCRNCEDQTKQQCVSEEQTVCGRQAKQRATYVMLASTHLEDWSGEHHARHVSYPGM
jgi:hypothetical protein